MVQIETFSFMKFFFFTYFFRKKIQKNYLKCYYMRYLSFEILVLFFKLFVLVIFFDNFLFLTSIHSTNFKTGLVVGQ